MNILNFLGYHEKWHLKHSNREQCKYSINEPIIEYILNTMSITKGTFVEFGAWDGILLSNCRKLYEKHWNGVFIEADHDKYKELQKNYADDEHVTTILSFVDDSANNLDHILIKNNINDVDFLSIDIDGLDLNVFNAMDKIKPKLICIEGGQVLFPTDTTRVETHIQADNVTQSLVNYINDFKKKGYRLLCAYQDIFFVQEEYYSLFNVSENVFENYLNGIFALPRIPWLYEKQKQYNITNEIVDYIIKNTNNSNITQRNKWVKDNESVLKSIETKLREKYC
jgi:hypothetical protein